VSLLGIRHVVLAINKMDLVDWSQDRFDEIVAEYRAFADQIELDRFTAIPMSALKGDNITEPSGKSPWYKGPALMRWLEEAPVEDDLREQPFRMPVQWVNRPNLDFRGFSGLIASGVVRPGDKVKALPSGRESTVERIVTFTGDLAEAVAGQSVTITLKDEIDVSRGDVLAAAASPPAVADQFETTLVWFDDEPMLPGRPYLMKLGTRVVSAQVAEPKYKINVNSLERLAATRLDLNEIGVCNLSTDAPIAFDAYAQNKDLGGFILIDRISNRTVGAGMLHFALRRSQNIHWQALDVDKQTRSVAKGQHARVVWLTGLSGSGKSTIANLVEKRLHVEGRHTYLLDGDNVRHGLNKDLGFTEEDRVENIRRVAEVAKLMVDAGLIVLVSFISPFRAERRMARDLMGDGEFVEVFVDTPLVEAERRDVKGLYAKARAGELKNFTGISSPYEEPEHPEIRIDTTKVSAEDAAERIFAWLEEGGLDQGI
jgi:bifunctional enzyme CysN/CysC